MNKYIKYFDRNPVGRDFAVGDIHGYFSRLEEALGAIEFDPTKDRLFSVGDLVDRGPESHLVLEWLEKPWFHAIQGNHEEMAIVWGHMGENLDEYIRHGGEWLMNMSHEEQLAYVNALAELPYAMEIETEGGSVGLVHADLSGRTWEAMVKRLHNEASHEEVEEVKEHILWSHQRYMRRHVHVHEPAPPIADVRAVVVGHTPVKEAFILGNVYYIDTAGWTSQGHFTFLDLASLELLPVKS